MSIVICFLTTVTYFYFINIIEFDVFAAIFISGFLIAFIGFWDDHVGLPAKTRMLIHVIASIIVVFLIGGVVNIFPDIPVVNTSWFSVLSAILILIWALNSFNFMDGIDGIAGGEALISTSIMGFLILYFYQQTELSYLTWALSASIIGFLIWNFPPAKIFMGDAGSGFLGIILATLMLVYGRVDPSLFWAWATILGIFHVDSTFTLIRRVISKEKIFEAHCSHTYQIAARKYRSHKKVTLFSVAINLFWLSPMAYAIAGHYINGLLGIIIAYIPLIIIAWVFQIKKMFSH